jgi:hypothetical protein
VISCLLVEGVRFLIVGGWAVRFHGHKERHVKDVDVLVELSAENWPRITVVLQRFLIPVKETFEELAQRSRPLKIRDLCPVDLLTAIGSAFSGSESSYTLPIDSRRRLAVASLFHGVSFGEAWRDSIQTSFGDGHLVRVLSKAHVILSKEQSSRALDAEDIKILLEAE